MDASLCEARQWPIMQALRALKATARPVLYRDEAVREIRDELLSCDAVLVWVNPLDISGDRSQLDPMLREVAGRGVVVSAHPDVIAKIGVKEVLYTTRSMEWGSDVEGIAWMVRQTTLRKNSQRTTTRRGYLASG
ncbi:MAG: hypothetical protein IPN48_16255 [Sphingomonadales bacterium]|nr:hypothetical protein [Sphingomonadales bacterium]